MTTRTYAKLRCASVGRRRARATERERAYTYGRHDDGARWWGSGEWNARVLTFLPATSPMKRCTFSSMRRWHSIGRQSARESHQVLQAAVHAAASHSSDASRRSSLLLRMPAHMRPDKACVCTRQPLPDQNTTKHAIAFFLLLDIIPCHREWSVGCFLF